ncbi:MAG: amidohydrolase family protein, partial [Methanosarcinales archaeon]|nr:amidohydrolase family protein [Methanosarcinales archaeon]
MPAGARRPGAGTGEGSAPEWGPAPVPGGEPLARELCVSGGPGNSRGRETVLSGTIIQGEEMEILEGYLVIRDGVIAEIGEGSAEASLEGIICPCFVNAHTHVGDSVVKDPPLTSLQELVGPGGLKHRALARTPREALVEGMRSSLELMVATGTCAFADFREGGPEGVSALQEALRGVPLIPRIFGRPDSCLDPGPGGPEGAAPPSPPVHPACWGLGISSTRDLLPAWIESLVQEARRTGKKVAIHAGEAGRDDILDALRLDPDVLVHLSRATRSDLERVASTRASVVVCPRSNLATGSGLPDVKSMMELGLVVGVGTDNVMLNSPDMFREMELISKHLLRDDRQVFMMCTLSGARILGIE